MMSNVILMALVPVFFVLLLGFVAGKARIVDNDHVEGLNALVMDFALPASLFAATASAPRDRITDQVPVFLVFGLTMLIIYLAWYWFERSFFAVTRSDAAVQALTVGFRILPASVCRSCRPCWGRAESSRSPSRWQPAPSSSAL